eukprot:SAG22_NODE_109_length_19706_cov_464.723772_5_plen_538_part_00
MHSADCAHAEDGAGGPAAGGGHGHGHGHGEGSADPDGDWCARHAAQLGTIGLPAALHGRLAAKLRQGVFDAGGSVAFGWADAAGESAGGWSVLAARDIEAGDDVFLCDHVWLFPDAVTARQQIAGVPPLRARLQMLLGLEAESGEPEPEPEPGAGAEPGAGGEAADALLAQVAPLAHPIVFGGGGGDETKVMYFVDDEIGSRVQFVPAGAQPPVAPNVCSAAIFDHASGQTYSVVWPCKDIAAGEELLRAAVPCLGLFSDGKEYWQRRFEHEEAYDWYCGWDAIAEKTLQITNAAVEAAAAATAAADAAVTVMVPGNGNSPLPVQLAEASPQRLRVVAVDYIESVVERMKARHGSDVVEWVVGDLTAGGGFGSFLGGGGGTSSGPGSGSPASAVAAADLILDKGCLDAFLVKPVGQRANEADTWITDPADPAAANALAYLANCAAALAAAAAAAPPGGKQQQQQPPHGGGGSFGGGGGGRMMILTRGRRPNREPVLRQAGLTVLSWEDVAGEATDIVRLGIVCSTSANTSTSAAGGR